MGKLLKSPKFWAITFGAVFGSTMYHFLGDGEGLSNDFPLLVIGAYSAIGLAGKANDIAKSIKGNTPS